MYTVSISVPAPATKSQTCITLPLNTGERVLAGLENEGMEVVDGLMRGLQLDLDGSVAIVALPFGTQQYLTL